MRRPICLVLAVFATACLAVLVGGDASALPTNTTNAAPVGSYATSPTPLPPAPAAAISQPSPSGSTDSTPANPSAQPAAPAVATSYMPSATTSAPATATASGFQPTKPNATTSPAAPSPAPSAVPSGLAAITAPIHPANLGGTTPPTGSAETPAAAKTTATDHVLPHAPALTPGEVLYNETGQAAHDNPANWSVYAYESRYELKVLYRSRLFKRYHAVFGRNRWGGGKVWEGDRRTPQGDYLIVAKHRSSRYRWFLQIDYPNSVDRARFERMKAENEIPHWLHEGGEIGIHGTDAPLLNVSDIDWTTGCISVGNSDISQLAHLLPIGTLVVIKP